MARVKIGNVRTPVDYLKQYFAPAGFGLGEDLPIVDKAGLDNWTSSGWCIYYDEINQDSTLGVSAFVNCKGNNASITGAVIQEAYKQDRYGVKILTRVYIDGAWQPWEWVNPPMKIGVEYRTTERFKDKPVYRKIVAYNLSATTNTDFSVPHGISNFDTLVRQTASVGAGIPLPYTHNGNTTWLSEVNSTNILVSNSGQSWDASYTWNFYLYYTKTTD